MSYIQWIRSRVGQRKIFLVTATVVVRDENGRILLQRRTDFDWWGLPGGALELDEDISQCARREVAEETGLIVGDLQLVGVYTDPKYEVLYPNGDQVQQFTICFTAQTSGGQLVADGVETKSHSFVQPQAIPWEQMPIWYADMLRDTLQGGEAAFLPPFAVEQPVDQIGAIRPFIGNDWYIGVGAMVVAVRQDGRILMIQRRDNGAWFFPAGYCNLGENVAKTAVRETLEETGCQVQLERILGIYSSPHFHHTFPNGDQVKNVGVLFQARPISENLQMDDDEVTNIGWMTPAEVMAYAPEKFHFFVQAALHSLEITKSFVF